MVRDLAVEWINAEGGKAKQLTEHTWLQWAGVSDVSACESSNQQALYVLLPARGAREQTEFMPARPARPRMVKLVIIMQQGSMHASCGETSGAQRSHEVAQLLRGCIGTAESPLPKNLYSSASPMSWLVKPHGSAEVRRVFGILWLLSYQVTSSKWLALAEHERLGTQPPAALAEWAVTTRARMSAAQNNPESTTTTKALWAALAEHERLGTQPPAALAEWAVRPHKRASLQMEETVALIQKGGLPPMPVPKPRGPRGPKPDTAFASDAAASVSVDIPGMRPGMKLYGKGRQAQLRHNLKSTPLCTKACPSYQKSSSHSAGCEHGINLAAKKAAGYNREGKYVGLAGKSY